MEEREVLHRYSDQGYESVVYADQIHVERDPELRALYVTFDIPEKKNALNVAAWKFVAKLLQDVGGDDEVKTVVFRGAGEDFGTGDDLDLLGTYIGYGDGTRPETRKRPNQRRRVVQDRNINWGPDGFEQAAHRCLKVVIVEAKGYCYGAHLQLAMHADMVIASDDALFTHPASRYLGPFINVVPLVETMGLRKFKEMAITGRAFTASEMERAGFVNKVVPREELEETVRDYVKAVSVIPLDGIVVGKSQIELALEARGYGVGFIQAWAGHSWITNLSYEEDEFNFMKNRRDRGQTDAMAYRDNLAPEGFKIKKSELRKAADQEARAAQGRE